VATGRVPTTANSPLTTKGDLFTYDTSQARLAVGSNGETLVADSSATTGLRWQGNYAAGKNLVINGDFRINQRNFSSVTTSQYGFDRFYFETAGGTVTHSAQTFTAGAAPVAGYEGINFARIQTTSHSAAGDYTAYYPVLEDARNLAGQTATVSFWAKAASGTPKVAFEFNQTFGTGGSPSAAVNTYVGQATLSTSWTRYSFTFSVPSVSGKTFGTNNNSKNELHIWVSAGSNFNSRTGSLGVQNNTFDFWGVQMESGSVATPFQTATGTLAGELQACQRYYWRSSSTQLYSRHGNGSFASATTGYAPIVHPVVMRVAATSVDFANLAVYDYNSDIAVTNCTLLATGQSANLATLTLTFASGGTQYRPFQLENNNNAGGYIGFSAEL
jgi:hypothetical protein